MLEEEIKFAIIQTGIHCPWQAASQPRRKTIPESNNAVLIIYTALCRVPSICRLAVRASAQLIPSFSRTRSSRNRPPELSTPLAICSSMLLSTPGQAPLLPPLPFCASLSSRRRWMHAYRYLRCCRTASDIRNRIHHRLGCSPAVAWHGGPD